MNKDKYRMLYASAVAVLGGVFIFGITASSAKGFAWHWPFRHPNKVVAQSSILAAISKNTGVLQTATSGDVSSEASRQVIVLMYHHVGDIAQNQRSADAVLSDLTVSVSDFESQVKFFKDRGYTSITISDLYKSMAAGQALPSKPIIFTFDDGYKDVFANAIPVLQKYGYTGSFAVATDLLGRPDYAVWDDVVSAVISGLEILFFTENHLDLVSPVYSNEDLRREIFGSRQEFADKLGHPVDFFVYPYGHTNEKITQLVGEAGFKMAFTTAFGTAMDPKTMLTEPRVRVHGVDGLEKLKAALSL